MNDQCTSKNDEHSKLMSLINYRFPHSFKKFSLISAVLVFVFLLGYKIFGGNTILIKDACRSILLFCLLIASLSKDSIEDEYIQHVRYQSYFIAFICAVSYAVGIPLIALILDVFITKITGDGMINFYEISSFEVMFNLMCFQLLFFEVMKRFGRAQ